jgi:hypothetical protein
MVVAEALRSSRNDDTLLDRQSCVSAHGGRSQFINLFDVQEAIS